MVSVPLQESEALQLGVVTLVPRSSGQAEVFLEVYHWVLSVGSICSKLGRDHSLLVLVLLAVLVQVGETGHSTLSSLQLLAYDGVMVVNPIHSPASLGDVEAARAVRKGVSLLVQYCLFIPKDAEQAVVHFLISVLHFLVLPFLQPPVVAEFIAHLVVAEVCQ